MDRCASTQNGLQNTINQYSTQRDTKIVIEDIEPLDQLYNLFLKIGIQMPFEEKEWWILVSLESFSDD